MIRVKCNKDLMHGDGSKSFSKGQIYQSPYATNLSEDTTLINDQKQPHRIGWGWLTHFKQL